MLLAKSKKQTMKIDEKDTQNSTDGKTHSNTSSSTSTSNSTFPCEPVDSEDSDDEVHNLSVKLGNQNIKNEIVTSPNNADVANNVNVLQQVFNATNSTQTLGNVFIDKSNGVHIGNITYVTGPIHINQTGSNIAEASTRVKESESYTKPTSPAKKSTTREEKNASPTLSASVSKRLDYDEEEEVEREEVNRSDAFIGNIQRAIDGNVLRIVNRMTWLAQRPLEPYDYLEGPAQFVIISHTGSEDGKTQAENVYLVRHVQCFHIESRRWNDIGYNFLIGCDGNVYQGRGWRVVGAHTYGYNKKSVGISFIGCFMREMPPDISIKACKLLIKRGIEEGHISPDYTLLGHCQCSGTESPGRMLFEEIQTWPHFSSNPTI